MSLIGDIVATVGKKQQLKMIEKESYMRQRELTADSEWEEEVRRAAERGIKNASMKPSERIKNAIKERKEKVAERRCEGNNRFEGIIASTSNKRDMSEMITGKGDSRNLVSPKKDVSQLFGKR